MQDSVQSEHDPKPVPPPEAVPGRFNLRPLRDADGKDWNAASGMKFDKIWDWGYWIDGGPPDPKQYELAIKISEAADTIREFGRPSSAQHKGQEGAAAQEIMTDLAHLFSAVLVQNQQADFDRSSAQVEKHKSDFFRRVVTPRHRRNLRGPVTMTIIAMLAALLIGFLAPSYGQKADTPLQSVGQTEATQSVVAETGVDAGEETRDTPLEADPPPETKAQATDATDGPGWAVLLSALCFVVAGTLMGRLLYFAMSHSEKIKNTDEYFEYESISGEAAIISLVFDVIVGIAAFVIFQTGLIIISIGAESGSGFQGISTLQIDESGLVAYGFGMLVGLSRTAFLGRLKAMSKDKFASGANS